MILISVIIPAHNEEHYICDTLASVLSAVYSYELDHGKGTIEILVSDSLSTDKTADIVRDLSKRYPAIRLISCEKLGAARARNSGVRQARGRVYLFLDADTWIPVDAFHKIDVHLKQGKVSGISRFSGTSVEVRSLLWWSYWNYLRSIPIPQTKALSGFFFCRNDIFDELGPFDERFVLGEEWAVMSGIYKKYKSQFIYDTSLVVQSSDRRMSQRPFGYLRTFLRWHFALFDITKRKHYVPVR